VFAAKLARNGRRLADDHGHDGARGRLSRAAGDLADADRLAETLARAFFDDP